MGEVGEAANAWSQRERANESLTLQLPLAEHTCEAANPSPLVRSCSVVLREEAAVLLQELKPTRESIVRSLRLSVTVVIPQEVADAFDDDHGTSSRSPDPPFDILAHSEPFIERRCDAAIHRHLPDVGNRTLEETSGDVSPGPRSPCDVGSIGERSSPADRDLALGKPFEGDLEAIAGEEIVIVEERHVAATCGSQPRVPGSGRTTGSASSDDANPRIDRRLRAGGTVLDDDALEIRNVLTQHRIDGLAKELRSSDRWHDDAE
jgi:hypothetical protein